MTLTQLNYLLKLEKWQHFGRAAQDCGVSQPSLSQQIQKLEEELGVILIDRSKSPLLFTDLGKAVVAQAREVIHQQIKIEQIVQEKASVIKGDFHLGIIPTLGPYLLPLFLEEFGRRYPDLNLVVEELKTSEIIDALLRDQLDAGILVTPLAHEGVIERVLFYEPFQVFLSPGHPLEKKKTLRDQDLDPEDLWPLAEGHCFRDQMFQVCQVRNEGRKNIKFAGGSLETLINLVMGGSGLTLLPVLATLYASAGEKKHLRAFHGQAPMREVSLVYARSFLKEKVLDALEETLVERLPAVVMTHKSQKNWVVPLKKS